MTAYKVMIIELHGRPMDVEANNSQEAIENIQKMLEAETGELPATIPLQLLSPLLWPITKASSLITATEDTKIIRPDFGKSN